MKNYLKNLIKTILEKDVNARDSWMMTIKRVHDIELKRKKYNKSHYYLAFHNGELSNVQSIQRIWRLIQEKCPHLRGSEWKDRQRQSVHVSKDIKELGQIALFEQ